MNNRVEKIQISGIRRFYEKVQKVEGAISLTIGQPDFNVPIDIKKAMITAIEQDKTTYTSNSGIESLRSEISKYLKNFNINYNKDEICITVGGSEGLYSVLSAILNEGDKILIPSPAYPAYESISNIIGADVINYSLNDDFTLNIDEVRKK